MKEIEAQLKEFERFEREPKNPGWVFPLRKAGMSRFAEQGFPTLKDEDWRFTNVAPIAQLPFHPVLESSSKGVDKAVFEKFAFGGLPGARLVFVDGHYAADLSTPAKSGEVTITSLAAALASDSTLLEKHLARHVHEDRNSFAALNTAFFQDGAFIHVPAGKTVPDPIHLLFVATAKETGAAINPRNLLVFGDGAQATVLESYCSVADGQYFTNSVMEMVVGEGARVEHVKFQDESLRAFHISTLHAHLGRACNMVSHSIATGARLSRHNIRTSLAGERVECILNGLYITGGNQVADHHMIVEHAQPNCNSHEYFNGILDGNSKGVFHGRILVRKIAQKTDAKQTNKNLLLSENATVDTKPQLEIYADDVKCTHGATIGQLNDDAIFYLRARGIGEDRARRMLIHSFAGEITERVRHRAIREELDQWVWDRLEENPHVGELK